MVRLIHDYKHIDHYRKSFNRLAQHVFGISFEEWYQRGYWNDRYICHSFVEGEEVVANVSVSRLQIEVEGTVWQACQIGTVMTHPNYRGQGLSAKLMDHVLQRYTSDTDIFYLFANRQVLDYYPRFGFRAIQDSRFFWEEEDSLMVEKAASEQPVQGAWRQLDLRNPGDERLLKRLLATRQLVSNRVHVRHGEGIFLWYALQVFPEGLYYHEGTEQLWVCEQRGHTLHLYDCVRSERETAIRSDEGSSLTRNGFPALFRQLALQLTGIRRVEFAFTPDKLHIPVEHEGVEQGDVLFVKQILPGLPIFPEHHPFKYPLTAQA